MTKQTSWEKERDKVLATPKFLKRGTKAIILPERTPLEVEVEGRYGKRQMYVVMEKDRGLIYVSPLQLVKIARAFMGDYSSGVTVEL